MPRVERRLPFRATPPPSEELVDRLLAWESIELYVENARGFVARLCFDVGGILTIRDALLVERTIEGVRGHAVLPPCRWAGRIQLYQWAVTKPLEAVLVRRALENIAAMREWKVDKAIFMGRRIRPGEVMLLSRRRRTFALIDVVKQAAVGLAP